nr:MAG TPA: hypothetical protein [Bacteriophage sp.]
MVCVIHRKGRRGETFFESITHKQRTKQRFRSLRSTKKPR